MTVLSMAEHRPRSREQDLLDAGWERRFVAAPDRAAEAVELYAAMGFEVRAEAPDREGFGPQCSGCLDDICRSYVVIYTRKKEEGA